MKNSPSIPEVLAGRQPLSRPFVVGPGQCLLRLVQQSPESKEGAIQRAMEKEWWGRVVDPMPRLFSNYWVWLGKKT